MPPVIPPDTQGLRAVARVGVKNEVDIVGQICVIIHKDVAKDGDTSIFVRRFIGATSAPGPAMFEMLVNSLQGAFRNPITYLVLLCLTAVSVAGIRLLKRAWDEQRRLQRLLTELHQLRGLFPDGLQTLDLDEIRSAISRAPDLLPAWDEFAEGLIDYRGILHNCLPADAFFKEDDYFDAVETSLGLFNLRFRLLSTLPGVLTGLGMLGTFGGIALGLGRLDGFQDATPTTILDNIGDVIVGLSSAFWTSIFGLLLALTFMVFNGYAEDALRGGLVRVRELIDRLFPRVTPEKLLRDQYDAATEHRSAQLALIDAQREQIDAQRDAARIQHAQSVDQRRQVELLEHIHQALAERDSNQQDTMVTLMQQQLAVLQSLRDESEESRSQLQTIADDLADSLSQRFQSSLETYLAPHIEKVVSIVEQQSSDVAKASVENARHFTAEMVDQLGGSMQSSFSGMSVAVEQFTTRFAETASTIDNLLSEMKAATTLQRDVVTTSLNAANDIAERSEKIFESWNQREEVVLSTYQDATERFIQAFEHGKGIADSLQSVSQDLAVYQETARTLLTQARETQTLHANVSATLEQSLREGGEQINNAARQLKTISQSTIDWVKTTTQAVESFGSGLSTTVETSLKSYDTSLSKAIRSLATAINDLEDLTYSLGEIRPAPTRRKAAMGGDRR